MTSLLFTDHNLSEMNDDLTSVINLDLLRIQLKYQRKKLFDNIELFLTMELSYGDIISRSDYENLSKNHQQLNQEYDLLRDEYQHLGHTCLYLINKTRDVIDERNKYYKQWQVNRSILTPRPDWDKVSNIIDGGFGRWKILSTGKSSEQLAGLLIEEITHGNRMESVDQQEYFEGDGDDLAILPFLRASKSTRIANRRMRRRMTGLLIKEIWTDKIRRKSSDYLIRNLTRTRTYASSTPSSPLLSVDSSSDQSYTTLADHVAAYFEKRFDSKIISIEMGYNLRDACLRYHSSDEINLFWGILTGQTEEMVYHYRMRSISQLLQHFIRMRTHFLSQREASLSPQARKAIVSEPDTPLSTTPNHQFTLFPTKSHGESSVPSNELILTNEQFLDSLKRFYPHKTASQIDELFLSAKQDLHHPDYLIEFSFLFIEDNENRFGKFLSTLIKQINEDRLTYVEQIKQILLVYPLISVSQFSRAIYMIDPKIEQNELHRYIEWVFQLKKYHSSQQIKPLDLEDLLRRLENCACFKH